MKRKKLLMTLAVLLSVAGAFAQEEFKFEVTTTAPNQVFAIPTCRVNDYSSVTYNWTITWDAGGAAQNVTGTSSQTSAGISHTYTTAGIHQITIKPNGGNDRWLAAFGFYTGTGGANAQANKDMVTKVISPITPLMTRTQAEITANTTIPPGNEWLYTFYGCRNLTMGPQFTFSDAWNSITTVGNNFARAMFCNCSGAAFTMNSVFNLPQNITTVGNYFAERMFDYCSGAAFQVNNIFRFPILTQTEINKKDVFYQTFINLGTTTQSRTAASIINGNPLPDGNRETFSGSDCFADKPYIPTKWGGDDLFFVSTEEFKFEVTTTATNKNFSIPVSGGIIGINDKKDYFWIINWGDASANQKVFGTGSYDNLGISHTYSTTGVHQITIKPGAYNDRWLTTFGFFDNTYGANEQTNKDMVTRVLSPITPLMTRSQAEITSNTTTPPNNEWISTFSGCKNLTMGPAFTFSDDWNSITTVGNYFACDMFRDCSGAAFTMSPVFNLPQNITTVGNSFAQSMFYGCNGAAFTMNSVFNLPQNITTVGTNFAYFMFQKCYGATFNMNTVFNLPQNITTVGPYFAYRTFDGCSNTAFQVNNVFKFPFLTQLEIEKSNVFYRTFYNLGATPMQNRTAASIINGNPAPTTSNRQTFTNSDCFDDRPYIPVNWGGDGLTPSEEFKFEITTTAPNQPFSIPLSGGNGNKEYNWTIYWGDNQIQNVGGAGSTTSAGIPHTYATPGTYRITIRPNGGNDRWLAAFGFYFNSNGANDPENKKLVTKVLSPITPLMTRTPDEITSNTATPPDYEWANTFSGCRNITMGPLFTFSNEWNLITTVGNSFADGMFENCTGDQFTMNPVFNLPQNITKVGNGFACYIFSNCLGAAFKMNPVFNLPQNITTGGSSFAQSMFNGCSGAEFTMNPVFNFPQGITTVGSAFAMDMFKNCSGAKFQVNNLFKFPRLGQSQVNNDYVFYRTFYNLETASAQSRTAASIINGNPTPTTSNRQTFIGSDCFDDRPYIPENWGGDGQVLTVTVKYNYNGATDGNSIPSTTVTYNTPYGALPSPKKEFTVTYNYNGSAQPNSSKIYKATFGGWYKENSFDNEITATTIVTTVLEHFIYAKWTAGTPLTLPTPAAYPGYGFAGWYKEAGCVNFIGNAGDSYTPTANTTLFAKWVSGTFTIKATSGPNGNINPSGLITVNAGSNSTFNFKPNSGYKINKVLIDDVENTKAKTDGFYTFKNVTQDHEISVTFSLSTEIESITNDELQITVFPNPTTGELNIQSSKFKVQSIEIYDVFGRKVYDDNNSYGLTVLRSYDLTPFPAGIYFLKITTETGIVTKKIVKN